MINHMMREHIANMFANEELEYSDKEEKSICERLADMIVIEEVYERANIYDISKTLEVEVTAKFIDRVLYLQNNRTKKFICSYDGREYEKPLLTILHENHIKELLKICYARTHNGMTSKWHNS